MPISNLCLDVGGVLLTSGWDHRARRRAAKHFKLDWDEMEARHSLNLVIYEIGKLTLKGYLGWVIFYKKRPFTRAAFWNFMRAQSKPCAEMRGLMRQLTVRYGLKVLVLGNEARELNDYRIHKIKLGKFVDAFVSSCLVGLHKPDPAIFRLALDIAVIPARQILNIENTPMFVQIAEGLGMHSLLHTDYPSTREKLATL